MSVPSYSGLARGTRSGAPLRSPLLPAAPRTRLRVCLVCDDADAERRAMEFARPLAHATGAQAGMQLSRWRIGALENDASRDLAGDDAEAADVIVIGLAHPDIVAGLDDWLELVLLRREACAMVIVALVAATDCRERDIAKRTAGLAEIAARHGAEFHSLRTS